MTLFDDGRVLRQARRQARLVKRNNSRLSASIEADVLALVEAGKHKDAFQLALKKKVEGHRRVFSDMLLPSDSTIEFAAKLDMLFKDAEPNWLWASLLDFYQSVFAAFDSLTPYQNWNHNNMMPSLGNYLVGYLRAIFVDRYDARKPPYFDLDLVDNHVDCVWRIKTNQELIFHKPDLCIIGGPQRELTISVVGPEGLWSRNPYPGAVSIGTLRSAKKAIAQYKGATCLGDIDHGTGLKLSRFLGLKVTQVRAGGHRARLSRPAAVGFAKRRA